MNKDIVDYLLTHQGSQESRAARHKKLCLQSNR